MVRWRRISRLIAVGLMAGSLGWSAKPLDGAESCQAFLDGLRTRELHDVALYYLNKAANDPTTDKAFLETIDFEKGVTSLDVARGLSQEDREKQLDEARNQFEKFLADHPRHPLAASAKAHLAGLLLDRARRKTAEAAGPSQTSDRKRQLREEARTLCTDAQMLFATLDAELAERQKKYRFVDKGNATLIAERDRVRQDAMLTRLALAKMPYEIAQTYEPGSRENRERLFVAAMRLGDYYREFAPRLAAYYARIDEARCYQELGNIPRAHAVLDEVLTETKQGEGLRRVRDAATLLALQMALLPRVRQYTEAVTIYTTWEKASPQHDEASEEALAIKWLAGEAALESARGLKANVPAESQRRRECLKLAEGLLTFAAQHPGEFQQKARIKLADPLLARGKPTFEAPQTYEDALRRAKLAWDEAQGSEWRPAEKARLQAESLRCFRFALAHAPGEAKAGELDTIRYCLAYLHWARGEYRDAVAIGELLARSNPDRPEAQQGAKIALAASARLVTHATATADGTAEREQTVGLARFIAERWPGTVLGDEAQKVLAETGETKVRSEP